MCSTALNDNDIGAGSGDVTIAGRQVVVAQAAAATDAVPAPANLRVVR